MAAHSSSPSVPDAAESVTVPWEHVDQFVGQFSHDIRNGLNSLELQLTFLGEISTDPEAVQEVKRLRGSIADLTRQIQAVRLAAGSVLPHPFPYPAGDFIEDLRERFNRQHADAAARVQWQPAVGTVALAIDPELTLAALLELLLNASRFTTPGTPISVRVEDGDGRVTFSLREQPAAPPKQPTDEWGHTPLLSTRRGGYGLGRFRARRIIEAQGGELMTRYFEAEGSLLTTVTFPVVEPGVAAH